MASTTLDLPEPLGPTTQVMPGSSRSVVAEAKDLKPFTVRLLRCTDLRGSAVGLLPAALQGIDIDQMLAGARSCDALTRLNNVNANPSALLAAMWYNCCNGKGEKDMVILPYKDRLELFSRYLQQLIMESLGKEKDLSGNVVHQGIAVYGNKGSTDQHAYVQQLRDGVSNFFVTFIEVQKDRSTDRFDQPTPSLQLYCCVQLFLLTLTCHHLWSCDYGK